MDKRPKNKRKALKITLTCLISLILIFSIISAVCVKNFYDGYFSRKEKPTFSGYMAYSDVNGYERKVVNFKSGKNTLTGYVYGEKNDKGLVVIAHGHGFGAESYLAETLYFVDKGWRVFSFDGTGTYESQGKGTIGLPQSLLDLKAALTYIKGNDTLKGLPVMLYGHSWGAYAVTAVLKYDYDITAVTSISGFSSPSELLTEAAGSMLGVLSYVEDPFLQAYQALLFGSTARATAVDGINSTDTPVMIIHGSEDKEVIYNGASIISHKNEITNPNVIYKTCSIKGHNGHNDLFESEAASRYIREKNEEYKKLSDSYDGNIPDEAREKYYAGIDKFKTSELDTDFMNEINVFFENNLIN